VIIAQSEHAEQTPARRPLLRKMMAGGERVVRERFGVDPDTCTGDHSCMASGCPSLAGAQSIRCGASRRPGDQLLRRLRLRGEVRSRRGALPVVLSRLHHSQSDMVGPREAEVRGAVIGWLQRRLDPVAA
jgi:indolepyruvate ferredoxin oxidoreductase alpha subunit